jgi:DNA-binding transcriptional LysR family regulator
MRRRIPSTQALVCFEAAARHESFTKAAQELALTQSAVCRQIAALERYLGVPLFRRTRRGVLLTEAGAAYGRRIGQRLDAVERDTQALMAHPGGGSLDVAVVPTFATRWLIAAGAGLPGPGAEPGDAHAPVPVFRRRVRRRAVRRHRRAGGQLAGHRGDRAAARGPGAGVQPGAARRPRAAAAAGADGVPAAAAEHPPARLARLVRRAGRRAPARQRYELFSMLAMAAAHGMGLALMPTLLIEAELARGELVVACDAPLRGERAYYLVTPERKAGDPLVTRLREWIVAEARAYAMQMSRA